MWWRPHLVLAHTVAGIEDDPLAHHHMLILGVVVETVVGPAAVLQLQAKGGWVGGVKRSVHSGAI